MFDKPGQMGVFLYIFLKGINVLFLTLRQKENVQILNRVSQDFFSLSLLTSETVSAIHLLNIKLLLFGGNGGLVVWWKVKYIICFKWCSLWWSFLEWCWNVFISYYNLLHSFFPPKVDQWIQSEMGQGCLPYNNVNHQVICIYFYLNQ